MALTAKVRDVLGRLLTEVRRRGLEIAVKGIAEMRECARMAMLARHSRAQSFRRYLAVGHCVSGMTTEADLSFVECDLAPDGLLKIARFQVGISHGVVEACDRRIVTYGALIAPAFALQNPGLCALAKIPVNGN